MVRGRTAREGRVTSPTGASDKPCKVHVRPRRRNRGTNALMSAATAASLAIPRGSAPVRAILHGSAPRGGTKHGRSREANASARVAARRTTADPTPFPRPRVVAGSAAGPGALAQPPSGQDDGT